MSVASSTSTPVYIVDTSIGQFTFENNIPGEPLNIFSLRGWTGWSTLDHCKICLEGPFQRTFEVTFQWGDTKNLEYISEVCHGCMKHIKESVAVNGNQLIKRRRTG